MQPGTSWSHQIELPGDLASASLAREFVRVHLVEHRSPGLVEDVRVVTSELATNAVLHAQTAFTVTPRGDHESVLLTVQDGSPNVAPVVVAGAAMDEGGRGLLIVARLSHRWGTSTGSDGAKSVWARFDKHPIS